MGTVLLQIYKDSSFTDGKLQSLWREKTQQLITLNPKFSPLRCGEVAAAILAGAMRKEAAELA